MATTPDDYMKGEKTISDRNAARTIYKFENCMLYYKRASETKEEQPWRFSVRTETEESKIMESCHAGVEGIVLL